MNDVDFKVAHAAVLHRIFALNTVWRTALVVVAARNLKYEEAAKELGIPLGTVKSSVHRARMALADDTSLSGSPQMFEGYRKADIPLEHTPGEELALGMAILARIALRQPLPDGVNAERILRYIFLKR